MNSSKIKNLGKRIKSSLSKSWQGAKNLLGNENADEAKNALNALKTTANEEYNKLTPGMEKDEICESVISVWECLYTALAEIKGMCDEDVKADLAGVGRAFAKAAIIKTGITKAPEKFTGRLKEFNNFETQVILLQLIADHTPRTSAIPSVVIDAANATSRFYGYAYAYACSSSISERINELDDYLKDNNTLGQKFRSIFSRDKETAKKNLEIATNKVAKAIYNKAKTAKIRQSIKTKGLMKYFTDSIKDLVGLYSDATANADETTCDKLTKGIEYNVNCFSTSPDLNIKIQNSISSEKKAFKKKISEKETSEGETSEKKIIDE